MIGLDDLTLTRLDIFVVVAIVLIMMVLFGLFAGPWWPWRKS